MVLSFSFFKTGPRNPLDENKDDRNSGTYPFPKHQPYPFLVSWSCLQLKFWFQQLQQLAGKEAAGAEEVALVKVGLEAHRGSEGPPQPVYPSRLLPTLGALQKKTNVYPNIFPASPEKIVLGSLSYEELIIKATLTISIGKHCKWRNTAEGLCWLPAGTGAWG